jgi:hypothetical protein
MITRKFKVPLSLNGQGIEKGFLTGELEIVELCKPLWTIEHASILRVGFEIKSTQVGRTRPKRVRALDN